MYGVMGESFEVAKHLILSGADATIRDHVRNSLYLPTHSLYIMHSIINVHVTIDMPNSNNVGIHESQVYSYNM